MCATRPSYTSFGTVVRLASSHRADSASPLYEENQAHNICFNIIKLIFILRRSGLLNKFVKHYNSMGKAEQRSILSPSFNDQIQLINRMWRLTPMYSCNKACQWGKFSFKRFFFQIFRSLFICNKKISNLNDSIAIISYLH